MFHNIACQSTNFISCKYKYRHRELMLSLSSQDFPTFLSKQTSLMFEPEWTQKDSFYFPITPYEHVHSLDLGHSQDAMNCLHFLYIYSCNQRHYHHLVIFSWCYIQSFIFIGEEKLSIIMFQAWNSYKYTHMVKLILIPFHGNDNTQGM